LEGIEGVREEVWYEFEMRRLIEQWRRFEELKLEEFNLKVKLCLFQTQLMLVEDRKDSRYVSSFVLIP
jgi:hypothetical protein